MSPRERLEAQSAIRILCLSQSRRKQHALSSAEASTLTHMRTPNLNGNLLVTSSLHIAATFPPALGCPFESKVARLHAYFVLEYGT